MSRLDGLLAELYLTIEDHRLHCETCQGAFDTLSHAHLLTSAQIHEQRRLMCPPGRRLMDSMGRVTAELTKQMIEA